MSLRFGNHILTKSHWFPIQLIAFVPDDRDLLYLIPNPFPFQCKNHVPGTFKVPDILFPAHAASAMHQPYELLLHFALAPDTGSFTSHSFCLPLILILRITPCLLHKYFGLFILTAQFF